jgi:FlaA1/EpsC-like NDP-sugar epimerase
MGGVGVSSVVRVSKMSVGLEQVADPMRRSGQRAVALMARHTTVVRLVTDLFAWTCGFAAAWNLLIGVPSGYAYGQKWLVLLACQVTAGLGTGLYRGRFSSGSTDDLVATFRTWIVVGVAATVVVNVLPNTEPHRPVRVVAALAALAVMLGARLLWRHSLEQFHRITPADRPRVLVFGAGEACEAVIRPLLLHERSPLLPVGLIDDDPAKRRRRVHGLRMLGTRFDLAQAAAAVRADGVLLAVADPSVALIRDVHALAELAGLQMYLLPPARQLLAGVSLQEIRPVDEVDLLGRHEVRIDSASVEAYVSGATVLVTGAGGSIGSELCRQLHGIGPARLVMLDRDESSLHELQLSLEGHGLLQDPALVVACIRDADRIDEVFARWKPEVVFHAAALKHLPLLEQHPAEAAKTNVEGTAVVLAAAVRHGVTRFVNISTDKAADPLSVLGASKRLAEELTALAAQATDRQYVSVRFGNVLASRGSVLPTFMEQIRRGGPVTVTDPDITRFFMTIPEAVRLVLQAGAVGAAGEILILDMGEPVRIADLARRLIDQIDPTVEIVYTGLRPGEKLHEVLVSDAEQAAAEARHHARILHAEARPSVLVDRTSLGVLDPRVEHAPAITTVLSHLGPGLGEVLASFHQPQQTERAS